MPTHELQHTPTHELQHTPTHELQHTHTNSVASKGLNKPKGYEIEADGFSDLCITPQSQGLQV
jgi:hypothetical protein